MRIIGILCASILFVITIGCNYKERKKIELFFVNPEIETPVRIDKNKFDIFFKDDISSKTISSSNTIKLIENELNGLKRANAESFASPDIRIKIILNLNNKKQDTIFMGRFVLQRNNQLYILPVKLKSIIYSEIEAVN